MSFLDYDLYGLQPLKRLHNSKLELSLKVFYPLSRVIKTFKWRSQIMYQNVLLKRKEMARFVSGHQDGAPDTER